MSNQKSRVGTTVAVGAGILITVVGLLALSSKTSRPPSMSVPAQSQPAPAVAPVPASKPASVKADAKPSETKAVDTKATVAAFRTDGAHLKATWSPLHFKPAIDTATNDQCLACHKEILDTKPLKTSPAGVAADTAIAWYQALDTYEGDQETFHARHLSTPFAKQVMNLSCNFCHQGHDPREEAPAASATAAPPAFALRKVVDPSATCLLCHGNFPFQNMELPGPWHESKESFETADQKNGCMVCHEEQFRTNRHQVTYLNAAEIEKLAKSGSSDRCYGCHGGRAWYRISYPFPRHPWPGMDKKTPKWAADRPISSDPRYAIKK